MAHTDPHLVSFSYVNATCHNVLCHSDRRRVVNRWLDSQTLVEAVLVNIELFDSIVSVHIKNAVLVSITTGNFFGCFPVFPVRLNDFCFELIKDIFLVLWVIEEMQD